MYAERHHAPVFKPLNHSAQAAVSWRQWLSQVNSGKKLPQMQVARSICERLRMGSSSSISDILTAGEAASDSLPWPSHCTHPIMNAAQCLAPKL